MPAAVLIDAAGAAAELAVGDADFVALGPTVMRGYIHTSVL